MTDHQVMVRTAPQPEEEPEARPDAAATAVTVSEGDLGGLLGYRLKRAYMRIHPAAQTVLAEFGLRVLPFSVLSVIVANPGISLTDTGQALKIEKPNVGGIVDGLVRDKLVERAPSTTDRRRAVLVATATGADVQRKAQRAIAASEAALLDPLTRDERATLIALLHKIGGTND
ncbi:MAG: hypothetical protein RLZ26_1834 [Pseudomonadota bacterium]|jgi:DNA-binding MarR family transcriptional regulator